jgi:hypothetical protein
VFFCDCALENEEARSFGIGRFVLDARVFGLAADTMFGQ